MVSECLKYVIVLKEVNGKFVECGKSLERELAGGGHG